MARPPEARPSSPYHGEDEFGSRACATLDVTEWTPYEIDVETSQRETDGEPMNRRG